MKILVEQQEIPVEIVKRRGVRNINLRLDFNTPAVKISAPYYVSDRQIFKFVEEKSDWIEKHFAKHFYKRKHHQAPQFSSGDKFLLQGQAYNLVVRRKLSKRTKIELKPLHIEVAIDAQLSEKEAKTAVKKALINFYKKIAGLVIAERTEYFANLYGLRYKNITIKTLKSRWGSCSREKNLNFNWRLIMTPTTILDYVVIHEVCHLKHLNHSQRFWDLVAVHCPQHKQAKKWLREHGELLQF